VNNQTCLHIRTLMGRFDFSSTSCLIKGDFDYRYRDANRSSGIDILNDTTVQHGTLVKRKREYRQNRMRYLSIKSADSTDKRSISSEKEGNSATTPSETKPNRGTEPEFASYLIGEMKPPSILDELSKLSASSVLNQRRSAAAKRSRSFALDNNDKDMYRQIIDLQASQKEKSRRKTAINVYRALIGNLIICTGTSKCFQNFCLLF
jgi:hypothetical protein